MARGREQADGRRGEWGWASGSTPRPRAQVCSACRRCACARWLDGWRAAGRERPRLWQAQLPGLDDQLGLGILDLMQLSALEGANDR